MLEQFKIPAKDRVVVREDRIRTALEAIFLKMGQTEEDARLSADVLVMADLRGVESHGASNMVKRYVAWYNDGHINPRPQVRVLRQSSVTATLDADAGLGLHTGPRAMQIAIEKAAQHGIGAVTVQNARHLGMLAYHAMLPLKHDMIGVCMSSADGRLMLPVFGAEPVFGTHPIAWAAPSRRMPPFVFDIATTQVAGNKIAHAHRIGSEIMPGWLARKDGTPLME